jgi:non-specific serine/threonine protein kinase
MERTMAELALRDPAANAGTQISRLSPREREVADLVAQGLSDREISSRLVISRRTAESHVAHIFAKLGFSSRVQLATYIARLY